MKRCKYCGVSVETDKEYCPLCYNKLDGDCADAEFFYQGRGETKDKVKSRGVSSVKIFAFISVVAVALCAVFNAVYTPRIKWSWVVTAGIAYLWIFFGHTVKSNHSTFSKLILQISGLLFLLYTTGKISSYSFIFSFIYPSVSLITLVFVSLIIACGRSDDGAAGYLMIAAAFLIGSVIILLTDKNGYSTINSINIVASAVAAFGIALFKFNSIVAELARKWHL